MSIQLSKLGLLLCGTAMMAAASSAYAQEAPNPERQSRTVEAYSRAYSVSPEEARRRLKIQREVGEINSKLEQDQADTFGGLYIEHTPVFRVVAKFTRDGAGTLARYTQDPLFVAAPATISQKALIDAQASVYALLKGLGIESASSVDIKTGRIKFVVEKLALVDQLKGLGTLKLPDFVDIAKATNLNPEREAKIEGGRGLKSGTIVNSCTSGFTVYDKATGASGARYLTTAGHCPNTLSYNNVNLPIKGENCSPSAPMAQI
jgi:hypothetical protein